jgi:hypothetical protein
MNTNTLTMIFRKNEYIFHCIQEQPEKSCYLLKFEMKACNLDFVIEFQHKVKRMFIYAVFPLKILHKKRKDIAILITLLNNNLAMGCWELNMYDGTLRFRISYIYEDEKERFEHIFMEHLNQAIKFTEACTTAILSVIFTDASPHEVFQQLSESVDASLN